MHSKNSATHAIRAILELDPSAVMRVLHHFQVRNVVPHRISAQRVGADYIQIDVEVQGLTHETARGIVAKIRATPTTLVAVLCDPPQEQELI